MDEPLVQVLADPLPRHVATKLLRSCMSRRFVVATSWRANASSPVVLRVPAALTQPGQCFIRHAEHVAPPPHLTSLCSGYRTIRGSVLLPQDRRKELSLPESQVKAADVQSYALYYGAPTMVMPNTINPDATFVANSTEECIHVAQPSELHSGVHNEHLYTIRQSPSSTLSVPSVLTERGDRSCLTLKVLSTSPAVVSERAGDSTRCSLSQGSRSLQSGAASLPICWCTSPGRGGASYGTCSTPPASPTRSTRPCETWCAAGSLCMSSPMATHVPAASQLRNQHTS